MENQFNTAADYFREYFNNYLTVEKFAQDFNFTIKQANSIISRGRTMHNKQAKQEKKFNHIKKLQSIGLCVDFYDLQKLEKRSQKLAEDCCNFLSMESVTFQRRETRLLNDVKKAFGGVLPEGFKLNLDPRGYALKIDFEGNTNLLNIETDFGGYGILVPDFK